MKNLTDLEKWALLDKVNSKQSASSESGEEREDIRKLSNDLGVAYMADIVMQLTSDAGVEVLRTVPADFRQQVLAALPELKSRDLREILSYPPGTAGALMAKEFLYAPLDGTVADVIELVNLIPKARKGRIAYIYVLDEDKKLAGVIQTKDLILNSLDTPIRDIVKMPVISVRELATQDEVAGILRNGRFLAVPVVDVENRLIGIVSADNILQAMKEQADQDIAKMVGTDAAELKTRSVFKIIRLRLPWLFVSIASGLFCAVISGIFQQSFQTLAALFLFVPIVLGLSESTGIQGATIVVRNLTLKKIAPKDFAGLFFREMGVGIIIGLICGVIVGGVTSAWQGSPLLGIAVACSMNVAIMVSALIGLVLPVVFRSLKIDPAIASGPLVLAICDIQTLFVYFSLASTILSR